MTRDIKPAPGLLDKGFAEWRATVPKTTEFANRIKRNRRRAKLQKQARKRNRR